MSIFVKFDNVPAEPLIRLNDVRGQAIRIILGDQTAGFGRIESIGYADGNFTGMLTVKLHREYEKLTNGRFYTGSFAFIKSDDAVRIISVNLDA